MVTRSLKNSPRTVVAAGSLLMLSSFVAPCGAQTSSGFYDESAVQEIRLEINGKDWDLLRSNYFENTYYPANFQWKNVNLSDVGIRSRGRGSRSPVKPNLRIDFDRFDKSQTFLGLKSTTLKANNQDASMLRERLTMTLFTRMGLPAPREAYARLYVNGEFFGLYTLVESIDKAFLRRTIKEDGGYLYDWKPKGEAPGYHFEYLGADAAMYSPVFFDPVTREKDPDPKPLVEMVRAINNASDDAFVEAISRYLDPKQFLRYLAAEMYMAEFDGVLGDTFGMNNFHVYRRAGSTVHIFIPWDKDGAVSGSDRNVMQGVDANVLTRRLLARPEFARIYAEFLQEAAKIMGGAGGFMDRLISQLYDQVAIDARRDPNKQCSPGGVQQACGANEFESDVELVRQFAQTRDIELAKQLAQLSLDAK